MHEGTDNPAVPSGQYRAVTYDERYITHVLAPGGSPMPPGASRVRRVTGFRKILRSPAGRITNQTLLVALVLVFGTGVATVAIGSPSGRWAAVAHGIAGLMILLLVPSKSRVGSGAAGLYFATAGAVRRGGLSGAGRRFTGSYETGSFDPDAMPTTIWLEDPVPAVDPDQWRLTVVDGIGRYQLGLGDLSALGAPMRATLDCTSGWYSRQGWSAFPVRAL